MTIRKGLIFQCLGAIGLVIFCMHCSDRQSRATTSAKSTNTPATTEPSLLCVVPSQAHTFNGAGVQFDYPGDWQIDKSGSSLFCIAAPGTGSEGIDRPMFTLDVPKLPWHIPGMISCGMVCSGYTDDLRKNHIPDAIVKEQKAIKLAGENAKQLISTGHKDGRALTDVAIITVHADRVYIFSTDCDGDGHHCDLAAKALESAMASVKWTR